MSSVLVMNASGVGQGRGGVSADDQFGSAQRAGRLVDGGQLRQVLAFVIDLQVLKATGGDHDLALQRADKLVVFADGGVERAADGGGVAAHDRQAFVELLAQFRDV